MAKAYRKETELKDNNKVSELLEELPDYISSYINHIFLSTTPKTRLGYLRDIKSFLEYIFDASGDTYSSIKEIPLSKLNSLDLDFFNNYLGYLTMYEKNGQIRENANVSVRRKLSSLRNLYSYLYINEYITSNPILKVQIPKVPKKELIRMDGDEMREFLSTVEYGSEKMTEKQWDYFHKYAPRDVTIMTMLLSTGMRVSELVGLDISDIDLKHSGVRVIRKGGKEDIVYFSDDTKETLENYLEYRKSLNPLEGHDHALFLSSQRKRITVRSVENLVHKYSQRTEILKHITPHKLRSTYGTALYEATNDLYLVAETLGHESVETTRKHYTEVTKQHKYENRNAVPLH